MVTPTLIANLKWRGYLIFMATNFLFMPLVYFAYPETTNMTLEEIDWLFMAPGAVNTSLQVQKYGWGGEDGPPIPTAAHTSTPSTPPGEEAKGSNEHIEKV